VCDDLLQQDGLHHLTRFLAGDRTAKTTQETAVGENTGEQELEEKDVTVSRTITVYSTCVCVGSAKFPAPIADIFRGHGGPQRLKRLRKKSWTKGTASSRAEDVVRVGAALEVAENS
jgi:hypothetical protein